MATATALPASNTAADKAGIFNTTILTLYPSIGNTEDLDKIVGTARLDTLYLAVAAQYSLPRYYGLQDDDFALYHAAQQLKQNTRISKSEFGEIKISVWDADGSKAAQLANGLLQQLQLMHQQLQNMSNRLILQNIQKEYNGLSNAENIDSAKNMQHDFATPALRQEQLQQYAKLMSEYRLMVQTNPPVLLVVEAARPPLYPDRPNVEQNVTIAFFASLFFSILLVIAIDGRSKDV
jgi:uncharacterized protein involved in exopolysaccharide biosynthesis